MENMNPVQEIKLFFEYKQNSLFLDPIEGGVTLNARAY